MHGQRSERCADIEAEEVGDDYERISPTATHYAPFRPNMKRLEKCSNFAKPREYELPVQQQGSNIHIEDSEHQYIRLYPLTSVQT